MPVAANLYYYVYEGSEEGQRPPLVLIHGAGGTHLHWPPEIRRLPGYRVFAPDLPGHGKSPGRGMQSIKAYSRVLLDWLGAVGIHRAVFVGHSMGSAIAISMALDHGEHVLGLGLIGSGARLRVAPELLENVASPATFYSAIDTLVGWSFCAETPERLTELAAQRMAETRPSVLYGDFMACNAFDEMQRVSEIEQPTLVICGIKDKMTPARYAQFLVDNIPKAISKTIPGAGHMVMLEKPRATAEALSEFLSGISY